MPTEKKTSPSTESTNTALLTPELVKIKKEKFDPEIEEKINVISNLSVIVKKESDTENGREKEAQTRAFANGDEDTDEDNVNDDEDEDDGVGNADDDEEDENSNGTAEDKKSIEPVKSSNEILAELFKVFNAAPPQELLDDKSLLKKSHKHKKHKKEKKKKVKREKSDKSEGERSVTDSSDTNEVDCDKGKVKDKKFKHKHKKKKKHKHKDEKEKDKEKNKDKEREKERSKDGQKSNEKLVDGGNKDRSKKLKSPANIKLEVTDDNHRDSVTRKRHSNLTSLTSSGTKRVRTDRERERSRDHDRDLERERDRDRDKLKDKDNDKEKEKERDRDKDRRHNTFYNGYRDHEPYSKAIKVKIEPKEHRRNREDRDGHISEISLSDEETYLKESDAGNARHDNKIRHVSHERNHSRSHNSFYAGVDRTRSRSRDRERDRERNHRSSGYSKRRSRSHSRSRSRSHDLGIDKKRLLEIARKNAISMFKRGNLPGCVGMSQEVKDKVLLKMRYGGKTVQDLTDFCKKISNGENLSDLSSDEDSDVDKNGNMKAFHHPFQLKEREPIVMHIRNATPITPRKAASDQIKAITMQFPVSSGQHHRLTEAWVPVEPKDKLSPLPALPVATQSTDIFKGAAGVTKNVFAKPMPEQAQEPAFKPVTAATAVTTAAGATGAVAALPVNGVGSSELTSTPLVSIPAPVPAPVPMPVPVPVPAAVSPSTPSAATLVTPPASIPSIPANNAIGTGFPPQPVPPPLSAPFVPDVPVPSTAPPKESIFPEYNGPQLDVSSIISKRLNAMRRLQENPTDSEAIKMMYNSQKEMSSWASSKHLPGQFTGSTGVNVLNVRELSSGPQAWARRDQLTSTQPVTGGMGMHLLQKMGWKPGEGLGREKTGSLQPLLLDVKLDKRGLVARDDNNAKRPMAKKRSNNMSLAQQHQQHQQHQQLMEDKHPVCLLNELTSKRKWTPPLYTLVNEAGPSHSKMFLFSVSINGQTYTPVQASNTKKEAKLIAARNCLQQMGILPM